MGFHVKNACIVLLLDAAYIPGAITLISSLRLSPCLSTLDIVLVSDDEAVLNHKPLARFATKRVFLDDEFVSRYSHLPRSAIPEKLQKPHVPKYTWLKFAAYQDFGYDSNIFIDADMLFLASPDYIFERLDGEDFDYAATRNIPHSVWEGNDAQRNFHQLWDDFASELTPFKQRNFARNQISFNSGFSIARRRLLAPSYIQDLFQVAAQSSTQFEQRINFLAMQKIGICFIELPIEINLTRPIYDRAIDAGHSDLISRALVNHYTFKKPWQKSEDRYTVSDSLWAEEFLRSQGDSSAISS